METEGSDIFSVINGGQQDKANSTAEPSSEEDFLDEGKLNMCNAKGKGESRFLM